MKSVVITGASRGIGLALATEFLLHQYQVAALCRDPEGADHLHTLARNHREQLVLERADVTDGESLLLAAESLGRRFTDGVDILVNNAGIASSAPLEDLTPAMWDALMAVNLRGVFLCTRAVLPGMYARDYGRIITTASQLAYKGAPGFTHYTAAKAAVIAFTRSLSLEIGARNVNANCVAPGATDTPILAGVDAAVLDAIRAAIPKGRIASVDDIAPAYVFLASDEARHFVGQTVSPNGGDMFL